ncbi:MAG: hypothetical protein ACTSYR_01575 [Candidatus Odinarchaeia archaeon]
MSSLKDYLNNIQRGLKTLFGKHYLIHTVILLISIVFIGVESYFLAYDYILPEFRSIILFGISIGHCYIILLILAINSKIRYLFIESKWRWVLTPILFLTLSSMFYVFFSNSVFNPVYGSIMVFYLSNIVLNYFSFIWLIIQIISISFLFGGLVFGQSRLKVVDKESDSSYKKFAYVIPFIIGILAISFSGIIIKPVVDFIYANIPDPTFITKSYIETILYSVLYVYSTVMLLITLYGLIKNNQTIYSFIPLFYLLTLIYMFYQLTSLYLNGAELSQGVGLAIIDILLLILLTFYSLQSIISKLHNQNTKIINEVSLMFALFAVVVIYLSNIYVTILNSIQGDLPYIIGSVSAHLILFIISPIIFIPLSLVLMAGYKHKE